MPESFLFPLREVDVWSPIPVDAPFAQNRRATWFTAVGPVTRGVTASEAQADLDRVQAQLGREYPATDAAVGVRVRPLKDVIVGGKGRSLWLVFAAVSLLFLIACTNMKKDRVDLENKIIWIPDSKTPNGVAEMPLTDVAVEALRDQMQLAGDRSYLFPSRYAVGQTTFQTVWGLTPRRADVP